MTPRISTTVQASALGRGTTETGGDLRNSCSDDRSTCTATLASRRKPGDRRLPTRNAYFALRRRIADYGTLGSLFTSSPPPLFTWL